MTDPDEAKRPSSGRLRRAVQHVALVVGAMYGGGWARSNDAGIRALAAAGLVDHPRYATAEQRYAAGRITEAGFEAAQRSVADVVGTS